MAVLMLWFEGLVVPVLGPVTSRSLHARRLGEMTIEESQDRGFKEFWGWVVRVVREQGARVAHNHPHELGGPSEWFIMPPEGIRLDRPLEGPSAALSGSFHQM